MKSFTGKLMLAAACVGLAISLTAGIALAGDRDGYRGGRDGGHYDRDHRGWSSHYDRCYRGGYYHGGYWGSCGYGYVGAYSPICVEADYCPQPAMVYAGPASVVVAPAPVVVCPAPVYRERVVVRAGYRGWGVGFYYGR
jgi:hypothetical protein